MTIEQKEAVKALAHFAQAHAVEVYGDNETEYEGSTQAVIELLEAVKVANRLV